MRTSMLAALLLLAPWPALAGVCGTGLDPITVSATGVAFGNYMPTSPGDLSANGSVTIKCGLGLDLLPNLTVALSQGGAMAFDPREMTGGAGQLAYNLFTAPDFSAIWGDGSGNTATQNFNGLVHLGTFVFTVYGRVPAGQFVAPGAYADNITVTVTF